MSYSSDWDSRDSPPSKPHSSLGLASCVIGGISGFALLILVIVAGVMSESKPDGLDEQDPMTIAIGLVALLGIGATLLGGVLGVMALFQRDRKPLLGIIGVGLNGLIVLTMIVLMVIGAAGD